MQYSKVPRFDDNEMPIRRIYVSPVRIWKELKIHKYFQKFGKIESITYHVQNDYPYAFILYEHASSALRAMRIYTHKILGESIKVKPAHCWHQVPSQNSPFNIVNKLNTDTLFSIFKLLKLFDLCSVADVCFKFKFVAECVFRIRFPIVIMKNIELKWERLFRNFGRFIKVLHLSFNIIPKDTVELISKYCSDTGCRIHTLYIKGYIFQEYSLQYLRSIIQHLRALHILNSEVANSLKPLLHHCNALTELSLSDTSLNECYQNIRNLKKIELRSASFSDDDLREFLRHNGQLKSFAILRSCRGEATTNALCWLGNYAAELEEIRIHAICRIPENLSTNLSKLAKLKNLKLLHLNCELLDVEKLLDALVEYKTPIEDLYLFSFGLNTNTAKSLSKLTKIINLKFSHVRTQNNLLIETIKGMPFLKQLVLLESFEVTLKFIKDIVKNLKNLEKLQIDSSRDIHIYENDFNEMVTFIKNRDNIVKLTITNAGEFDLLKLNVPGNILDENRQWLDFKSEKWIVQH